MVGLDEVRLRRTNSTVAETNAGRARSARIKSWARAARMHAGARFESMYIDIRMIMIMILILDHGHGMRKCR